MLIASDELVPEAAFARIPDRLHGDGLDIGETLGGRDQGPVGRGTGHERTTGARLGGGRTITPCMHNMATRALIILWAAVAPVEASADLPGQRPAVEATRDQGAGRSRLRRSRARSSGGGCRSRSLGESGTPGTQTLLARAPRQPGSRAFRRRTAMSGAGITKQPAVRQNAGQRAEDGIEHTRQPHSVHAMRPERELPADTAQAAFGRVVVHGNGCVVDEHCQAVAMAQQGVQRVALRRALRKRGPCLFRHSEERSGEPREPPLGGGVVRARQTSGVEPMSLCQVPQAATRRGARTDPEQTCGCGI